MRSATGCRRTGKRRQRGQHLENLRTLSNMKHIKHFGFFSLALLLLSACGPEPVERAPESAPAPQKPATPMLEHSVVATLPHDTSAFTEGLLFYNGQLLESTGSPEGSSFRSVIGPIDPKTGKLQIKAEIDGKAYFGEGIVVLNNKIYQ